MAKYHVRILKAASQELERLDNPITRRIAQRVDWLSKDLNAVSIEALTGDLVGLYKLRVGDYRVIYEVLWDKETVIIHTMGHRREIYRRH